MFRLYYQHSDLNLENLIACAGKWTGSGKASPETTTSTFDYDWTPSLDLTDRGDTLVAELEVPGMDPKDINISVTGDVLTISGEKKREREENEHNYHLLERSYGKFSRSVRLPSNVNPDRVEASYKDGILTIGMDKREQAKIKKIEVKAS